MIPKLLDRLGELEPALDRLESMNLRIKELQLLENIVPKFETLDESLKRLSQLQQPRTIVVTNVVNTPREGPNDWSRLKQLAKFAQLADRAKDIETEWQKIQQDEHDSFFAFQMMKGSNETDHAYKKGISDGVKWCVERFG